MGAHRVINGEYEVAIFKVYLRRILFETFLLCRIPREIIVVEGGVISMPVGEGSESKN